MITKEEIEELIIQIRKEHGLPLSPFEIDEIRYDKEGDKLFIIAHDRTDKSVIIGSSLVIGKLREILGVNLVTVYTTLDLLVKRETLKKSLKFAEEHGLDFLIPIIEAEFNFPPRNWPQIKKKEKGLIFLTFNAPALLGFGELMFKEQSVYGIRYTFPKLNYKVVDRPLRELFFPDSSFVAEISRNENVEIAISEFQECCKVEKDVILINPMRFFGIGYFETKYLFGETRPAVFQKEDLIDYVVEQVGDGLMEATDGAKIIWWGWKH
ncbi:hypothetical protein [Pyrococcus woesei]|uniref:hypothetical protein n=1 Tax=Pyrococcus woesei TaxID=2262 RepID=UPI003D2EFF11